MAVWCRNLVTPDRFILAWNQPRGQQPFSASRSAVIRQVRPGPVTGFWEINSILNGIACFFENTALRYGGSLAISREPGMDFSCNAYKNLYNIMALRYDNGYAEFRPTFAYPPEEHNPVPQVPCSNTGEST